MKFTCITAIVSILLTAGPASRAADDPPPPPNRPDPAALRERAKSLSPDQRQKMVREFREKHGLGGTNRSDWEQRREELKGLPPEEREARLKALRREIQERREQFKLLSTEERDAKRKEMKERIEAQVAVLQKKKADGSITEADQRRMERMQLMSRRLEQGGTNRARHTLTPDDLPPPRPNKPSAGAPAEKPADLR